MELTLFSMAFRLKTPKNRRIRNLQNLRILYVFFVHQYVKHVWIDAFDLLGTL